MRIFDRLFGRNRPERDNDQESMANIVFYPQEPTIHENDVMEEGENLTADEWTERGVGYCNLGLYNKSVQCHTKAIELNPRDAEAYNNRGTAYAKLGDIRKAIEDFKRFIGIAPPQYAEYVKIAKELIRELKQGTGR